MLEQISFWAGVISSVFVILHLPSCNVHWANRLKPVSKYLKKFHSETLGIAVSFAIIHLITLAVYFVK